MFGIATILNRRNTPRKFERICTQNSLTLDSSLNLKQLHILEEVFVARQYADYFPFYEACTILDIGAHYGYFSLFAAQHSDAQSRIIAVEPSTKNFAALQKNTAAISKIDSLRGAVSADGGIQKLYHGAAHNHSLHQEPNVVSKDFEEVSSYTLQQLMEINEVGQIDFMKMDCEGAEYQILENTPVEVFNKIDTISLEFHDLKTKEYTGARLLDVLKAAGYEIKRFQHAASNINLNYGHIIAKR